MKILFITDVGDTTGIGGHIYSVQSLVAALADRIEPVVVSLGSVSSPALESLSCRRHRLAFRPGAFRRAELAEFMQIVQAEKPDVIHAFDPIACAFARAAAQRTGCGMLLTMCGGPNPPERMYPFSYFPRVPHLIVFSEENEHYFRNRREFRRTRVRRIPNRINEVAQDPGKIAALRARLDPSRAVVLRIGRIAPNYGKTAEKTIRLVKRLVADGVPAQAVFLGAVQDAEAERAIRAALDGHGAVISDPDLVGQASALLDAGDLIVGTGRGLMEAASRGRILLVPAQTGDLPTLVNANNWQSLFDSNFSERCKVEPWDEERNYRDIRRALGEPEYRRQLSEFGRKLYVDQFSLESVVESYLSIYAEARQSGPRQRLDEARHWLWMMFRTRNRPLAPIVAGAAPASGEA